MAAVTASGGQLGEPPWDAARLREFLIQHKLAVQRTIEFLTAQGQARPQPQAAFGKWLAARLDALPPPVAAEVGTWAEALQGRGQRAGPARQDRTIQGYLRILEAPLVTWAA